MISVAGGLAAPFPYFGGKARAASAIWSALGDPPNYVEPFAGSVAVLLHRPSIGAVETINDKDGFVSNFWRAVASAPEEVACFADWPVTEVDLLARHSWLVRQRAELTERLEADPDFFDAKIAGWWCWGACAWIGSGWCSGSGPWVSDGQRIVDARQLPHLGDAGKGVNRKLPHLGNAGKGVNRQLPHLENPGQGSAQSRAAFISDWFKALRNRLRDVRVACGDWSRVLSPSVTWRHGETGIFLDPPYTAGNADYAVGGCGGEIASAVREWCLANGSDRRLRIVLSGHAGEHDDLLSSGWRCEPCANRKGYSRSSASRKRSDDEVLYLSPYCNYGRSQLAIGRDA